MYNYLLSLLFVALSLPAFSQTPSLEEVLSYSFPYSLTADDDKGGILWVENEKGVRNIYYATPPEYKPQRLTDYNNDDGQELSQMHFVNNQKQVVYVRGGSPNSKGELPNPTTNPTGVKRQILLIDVGSGKITEIAEGHDPLLVGEQLLFLKKGQVQMVGLDGKNETELFQVRGSVNSLRLSPDREHLAFVNSRGDHSYIGIYHLKDSTLQLINPSIDQDSDPVWSPDGKKLAYIRIPYESPAMFVARRESSPFSLYIYDLNTQENSKIFTADKGQGSAFRFISADNQIFWTADSKIVFPWEKSGWTHLHAVPTEGGKPIELTPSDFEVQFVSQSPDQSTLIFSSNQDDINRQHIWTYDKQVKQHTTGKSVEWSPVIDGKGNMFCLGSTGTSPAGVMRIINNELEKITIDKDYPSDQLVEPKAITFTSPDGMEIHGQLFVPGNLKKGEKRPVLLHFHGGSRRQMLLGFHHRGYYHHMYAMNEYMASQGYIVLTVNYRSGIGYGLKFREAENYGAAGASEYNDVLGAAQFLKEHPNVDDDRIGLWGGSYGGYLTAMGLAKNSDIFAAGVDIHGVYDWNVIIKNFMPSYNAEADPEFKKMAYASSPANFMSTWRSPVLLIHGDDDRNVPFSETVEKAEALRNQGVYYEQLVFPDEVHGFLRHNNWLQAFKATEDFFNRKLKK